jgi:hypothetical protein
VIESEDLKDLGYATLFRGLFVHMQQLQVNLVKSTAALATALSAADPNFAARFQVAMHSADADEQNMSTGPELEQTLAALEQAIVKLKTGGHQAN